MWEYGEIVVNRESFLYSAKVFDIASPLGIRDGRISKLQVVKNIGENPWNWDNTIINYDRGWDICPRTDLEKEVLKLILKLYK